jgi:hypothetical protein
MRSWETRRSMLVHGFAHFSVKAAENISSNTLLETGLGFVVPLTYVCTLSCVGLYAEIHKLISVRF